MILANLAEVNPGESGIVRKISVRGLIRRRLMDMGLVVGEIIMVKKIAPLGDPMQVTVKDYSLSLRKREAAGILVERIS